MAAHLTELVKKNQTSVIDEAFKLSQPTNSVTMVKIMGFFLLYANNISTQQKKQKFTRCLYCHLRAFLRRHGTQHNDTQHKGLISDIESNNTQHNETLSLC
jgi:hypothetical protein